MSITDSIKKTTIDRIKVAAPLTIGMLSLLFEHLIIDRVVTIFSIKWFCSIILFFTISTLMLAALMYNYKLLDHSCKSCSNRWSFIQSNIISVSNAVFKINLIVRCLLFKIDRKFKTYTCEVCKNVQHKKTTKIIFMGITSKK